MMWFNPSRFYQVVWPIDNICDSIDKTELEQYSLDLLVILLDDSLLKRRVCIVDSMRNSQLCESDSDEFVISVLFGVSWILCLLLMDVVDQMAG